MKQVALLIVNLLKLLLCGIVLAAGIVIGGKLASLLGMPAPQLPPGADQNVVVYQMLATPLVALALALLAVGLTGGFVARALMLSFFGWIAFTVNTQLEASIFTAYAVSFWFAVVAYLVAFLLCGSVVAWLFPASKGGPDFATAVKQFFGRHSAGGWLWRLAIAAVAFAPVYFFFGLLVVPFTAEYYRQNLFGLTMPTLNQILPILFTRSVLFLLACLPIMIAWQASPSSLFLRLGLALYILVGLVYMLISTWLPPTVRLPHSLEIFADEFVYAGILVGLVYGWHALFPRLTEHRGSPTEAGERVIPQKA